MDHTCVVAVARIEPGKVDFVVLECTFECAGQDLFVKLYRYELPLGMPILFVSRHVSPLFTKRSAGALPSSICRFYHALRTFSTASTLRITGWQWSAAELPVQVDAVVRLSFLVILINGSCLY